MALVETPVSTFHVEYQCDQCSRGLMKPYGDVAWLADPIQYQHRCTNCGHEQTFLVRYPYLAYKEQK